MSNLELEYAAMAPHRCLNYLNLREKVSEEPNSSSQFPQAIYYPILGTLADSDLEFKELFLVPGGRFLVSLQKGVVALWDLEVYTSGIISKFTRHIEPLAFDTPGAENVIEPEWIMVHPTTDGRGLHIHVHAEVTSGDDVIERIYVHAVYSEYQNTQLRMIASLDITADFDDIPFYSMSFNKLIFLHGNELKVWDYVTGKWASWEIDEDIEFKQIIVTETSISLLGVDGVFLWPIPSLSSSRPPFTGDGPQLVQPLVKLSYPTSNHEFSSSRFEFNGAGDWYTGSHQPYIFDLVEVAADKSIVKFWQYEVIIPKNILKDAYLRLTTVHSLGFTTWNKMDIDSYSVADQHLISWGNRYDLQGCRQSFAMAFVYSSPNELRTENPSQVITRDINRLPNIYELDDDSTTSETLCTGSGRLAWIDMESNAIYIADLLSRPNEGL